MREWWGGQELKHISAAGYVPSGSQLLALPDGRPKRALAFRRVRASDAECSNVEEALQLLPAATAFPAAPGDAANLVGGNSLFVAIDLDQSTTESRRSIRQNLHCQVEHLLHFMRSRKGTQDARGSLTVFVKSARTSVYIGTAFRQPGFRGAMPLPKRGKRIKLH